MCKTVPDSLVIGVHPRAQDGAGGSGTPCVRWRFH
jgi:hypothetical protein